MSKIAIISQPDQGVLIDVGGCSTLQEATQHLTSTLQISSEFWAGMNVDLNLGALPLNHNEVSQILAIAAEVGIKPHQVFAESEQTRAALHAQNVPLGQGKPMNFSVGPFVCDSSHPHADKTADASACGQENQSVAEACTSESEDASGSEAATTGDVPAEPPAKAAPPPPPAVLYLRQTLRSGQTVSHKGHLVIVGDVNPGAEVVADGDITVWGALRGIAHAGMNGNTQAEIRALRLEPIQIRIAHAIARSPDRPRKSTQQRIGPETARVVNGSIRITANNPD
jgi:septum site-determining protein MinC